MLNGGDVARIRDSRRVEFVVENLGSESEAAAVRRGLAGQPGMIDLIVDAKAAKVRVAYAPEAATPAKLAERLRALGFPPKNDVRGRRPPMPWENPKVLAATSAGVLLALGWVFDLLGFPQALATGFYAAAIGVGGYHFGQEAIGGLAFEWRVGIELLMTVAAVAAAALGQFAEAATLVFLYSISEAAESYAEQKTRSAIRALMELAPRKALVLRDGRQEEIAVEELRAGDVFLVRPGQSIATDGEVVTGESSVDQAPVTGESMPVAKRAGDTVFAGSVNGEGGLQVKATRSFAESTISRIIELVEEAQDRKGKGERFVERFGRWYSPAALAGGVLIALLPPLMFEGEWRIWLVRATVFVVAAAPCALVISIPIALVAALGAAARRGVLIKGGIYMEELARIRVVAFDKTGTITTGAPEVTDVVPAAADGQDAGAEAKRNLLALAAGIEAASEHPLARAVRHHAERSGVAAAEVTEFRAVAGAGAIGRRAGRRVHLGSARLFREQLGLDLGAFRGEFERLQNEGKTVVVVGEDDRIHGLLGVRDAVRPNAARALERLRAAGIRKTVMLTGDNERVASIVGREVGIDEVHAGLTPEGKVAEIHRLATQFGHVAMVGDGINDAPALAEASIGIAMGAAGTDVALETADVALMSDDLAKLAEALRLAQRVRRIVTQNLALSALLIPVLVAAALADALSLPLVILAHELSELVIIANGLRALRLPSADPMPGRTDHRSAACA